tara:strand:- start:215 stop:319 length:105 start_codon:yes stop_codon:yes gene_type:complete
MNRLTLYTTVDEISFKEQKGEKRMPDLASLRKGL